jgi:hypothetical protein
VSPAVAHAVLGVSPAELDHAVVALDELWGRDATRIREQLGETRSWESRFALTDAVFARRYEPKLSVDPRWHGPGIGLPTAEAAYGSMSWRWRSAGAASVCGPGSDRRSVCLPSTRLSWFDSIMRRTVLRQANPRPGSRRKRATPTSPTCIVTSLLSAP